MRALIASIASQPQRETQAYELLEMPREGGRACHNHLFVCLTPTTRCSALRRPVIMCECRFS